jgi:hypothetical protein
MVIFKRPDELLGHRVHRVIHRNGAQQSFPEPELAIAGLL